MLAMVDFHNPLIWALLIGWILSVVLHEFAHGLVGYLGGDYTIRDRGGLTLNPIQYIDPLFSIVIPAVIFVLGGIPLPGGSTYIRRDLLKNRYWSSAVSLAGPAMNFLLGLLVALPLHPRFGWMAVDATVQAPTNAQLFLGAMAWLQMLAVLFNLVPIPPLDGFQAISPFMNPNIRGALLKPQVSRAIFFVYFLVLWKSPTVVALFFQGADRIFGVLGFDSGFMWNSFYHLVSGR